MDVPKVNMGKNINTTLLSFFQKNSPSLLTYYMNGPLPDRVVAHTSMWLSSRDVAEAAVAPNISPAVARETPIFAPGGIGLINSSSGISF